MKKSKDETINFQEAIQILMLSPLYFLLSASQRLVLVKEYCQTMNALASGIKT